MLAPGDRRRAAVGGPPELRQSAVARSVARSPARGRGSRVAPRQLGRRDALGSRDELARRARVGARAGRRARRRAGLERRAPARAADAQRRDRVSATSPCPARSPPATARRPSAPARRARGRARPRPPSELPATWGARAPSPSRKPRDRRRAQRRRTRRRRRRAQRRRLAEAGQVDRDHVALAVPERSSTGPSICHCESDAVRRGTSGGPRPAPDAVTLRGRSYVVGLARRLSPAIACTDRRIGVDEPEKARRRHGDASVSGNRTADRRRRCRSWPSGTCGCTSRAWAPTTTREVPIIVRGDGCYVYDEHGKRYLDGLAGAVLREHRPRPRRRRPGRRRPGEGARLLHELVLRAPDVDRARRARSPSSPRATSTASSSPRAARRRSSPRSSSARQYHKLTGNPGATRSISRKLAYHGTTMGALTRTGIPAVRAPFEPLFPGRLPRAEHQPLPRPEVDDPAEAIRERILFEGPETVVARDPRAGAELRRLLRARRTATSSACARSATSSASCCISDEVICSWGRLGDVLRRREASTTSPTSSRRPRASPPPTRRWAR